MVYLLLPALTVRPLFLWIRMEASMLLYYKGLARRDRPSPRLCGTTEPRHAGSSPSDRTLLMTNVTTRMTSGDELLRSKLLSSGVLPGQ